MEPIIVNQSSSQLPFYFNNIKVVENNHDADWLTKINNPIEPAVVINNQPNVPGTILLNTDQYPNGTLVNFILKPCGHFVEYKQTIKDNLPVNLIISKSKGFSKKVSSDSKVKVGFKGNFPSNFKGKFKYISKFDYSGETWSNETTSYSQLVSSISYVHESLVTYAYKLIDSIDHQRLMKLNPDYTWKAIGNDLYFFVSLYSNNQIIRTYDSKYQMVDEQDFIDFLSKNKNLWDN
ncbi:hypothetical protein RB653_006622 [Dictyostelium firmibasis]|uniref:Monalysin Pore-forming domain-containing protein n=1 Tax=Dictyostelium firmibasis TaxID=79012 RepID=A0AAN7TM40_9MYCE